jgi:hypothetical protein
LAFWLGSSLGLRSGKMKTRIVIGEIERAGKPLSAVVTNFELTEPRNLAIRFRDAGDHFVMEQFVTDGRLNPPYGLWCEVMCYVKNV